MERTNFYFKTGVGEKVPMRKSPREQLWELTNEFEQRIFMMVFRRLKKRDEEDLCYALIAYIRFRILRPFECPFMRMIFMSFIEIVDSRIGSEKSFNININFNNNENYKSTIDSI